MRRTILWAASARIITVGLAVIVALMLWMSLMAAPPATKASAQEPSNTTNTLWVVARADGSVVRSSGLTGLTRLGQGRYEARFRRDVSGCAYTATVGDPSNNLVFNPGLVFTAGGHQTNAGVYVETKGLAGGLGDYPFHLTVRCPATDYAVVNSSGSKVRGTAQSVSRLGPGRYEVVFNRDVSGCAYTATVGDPSNNLVFNPGLVFTAGGHQSKSGVYVETKNLGGGLADYPFHLAVNCSKPPLDAERLSLLHLNLANLESGDAWGGPWRVRYRRFTSWMGRTQTIPDLLVFQEAPASRCHFLEGCNPKDYEVLFGPLISEIEKATGIRYRVALLSTPPATDQGLYDLFVGQAVLYNPARLTNTMSPTSASVQPFGSELSRTVERRESYPCKDPPQTWQWCSLVDRQGPTWGLHWAVGKPSSSAGRSALGSAFARFVLREHAQSSVIATIDVYDVHAPFMRTTPPKDYTPDLEPIGDAVYRIDQVNPPAAGRSTRLFPPILAGDFNAGIGDMNKFTTEPGWPFFRGFEIAAYANVNHPEGNHDVIGILVGEPSNFQSRYAAKADNVKFLPESGQGLCGPLALRWSDHCGQYAELIPIPR